MQQSAVSVYRSGETQHQQVALHEWACYSDTFRQPLKRIVPNTVCAQIRCVYIDAHKHYLYFTNLCSHTKTVAQNTPRFVKKIINDTDF